ncbi:MAG: 2-oxoglutarate dehydrogenase E1 component [Acidobacteria bacterium]|nr:2-oxoglutarate dehydrogenase E1 component [Acidobacteriota bacterium]
MENDSDQKMWDAFRRWGYFEAQLDPLGRLKPLPHPELDRQEPSEPRKVYCGSIGVEFMHIPDPGQRLWILQKMEGSAEAVDREHILRRLIQAQVFEQVLQSRYIGTKRFSLEGSSALLVVLDHVLNAAGERGAEQAVIAMSHRGRLNVMVHIVGKSPSEIFAGFEDLDPRSVLGSGDVKYHLGATGVFKAMNGASINIHLVSNPSHLEAVDAVALGRVRAKQTRLGEASTHRVLPVILHGDGAFAGQGIAAEALNMANLNGYSVGGAVHVIVNNLIGFTTDWRELHSTPFASDVAKRLPIPIFHVNAEDPEAAARVARWACEFRYQFATDVVIDLIGYRRHGHSEIDDPTITQPVLYEKIKAHPVLWRSYAEKLPTGIKGAERLAREIAVRLETEQEKGGAAKAKPVLRQLPAYWSRYRGGAYDPDYEVNTGVTAEELHSLSEKLTSVPGSFAVHEKVQRLLRQRAEMGKGKIPVDFGMAEALAFASLLMKGIPVRLSGQDSRRGTFNHRHSVLIDVHTEEEYVPLAHLSPQRARFESYNSMLSEFAVLGYEYGYSRDYPDALVIWEAQFGDFANGAQVIIDQFISAGEDKWDLLSGIVLLLPHGYEGQGPEHSSARIERYLQLAAEDNIQVCQPSTSSQYFHLLRRQALRSWRKPLVLLTPKSMLRHADAASPLEEFSRERFLPVIYDPPEEPARRLLICSGKIGHELHQERRRRRDHSTAIIRLDQLYPFPEHELENELKRYPEAVELVWVQEEPANMGALFYVLPELERLARGRRIRTIKRSASASPATGSAKAHAVEQKTLLTLAFSSPPAADFRAVEEPARARDLQRR